MGVSIPEVKELLWCDIQNFTQFKNNIKGDSHFPRLNGTDMASINLGKLCLKQREHFSFTIVDDVESELFIRVTVFFFRMILPTYVFSLEDLIQPTNLAIIA